MKHDHTHRAPTSRKPPFALYREGASGPEVVAELNTVRLARAQHAASSYNTTGCWLARVSSPGKRFPVKAERRPEHKFEREHIKLTTALNFKLDSQRSPSTRNHRRKA